MKFTGERFIPGLGGCQIAYEHLHRYFFALRWADGSRVLDLACGSGYGAALLARRAHHVWALDLDVETIETADRRWREPNLSFLQANATQLPFHNGSMDLVVAMEILEHVDAQEALIREAARVCSPTGVVLVSTPSKAEYSDARNYQNPFHKRELYLNEFVGILKEHFPFVEIAGQQIRAGSLIASMESGALCEIFDEAAGGTEGDSVQPMYYLAICSRQAPQTPVPHRSAFLDSTDGLMLEAKHEITRLGEWGQSLECVIGKRDRIIRDLQMETALRDAAIGKIRQELAERDQTILDLQQELGREIGNRDSRIVDLLNLLHSKEKEFDERGKWALSLQAEVERLSRHQRAFLYRILANIGLLPK